VSDFDNHKICDFATKIALIHFLSQPKSYMMWTCVVTCLDCDCVCLL